LLVSAGKLDEARIAFAAAKKADPQSLEADEWLARTDLIDHKPDAARARLTSLVSAHPDRVSTRILLAESELTGPNAPAAASEYQRTLAADPNNIIALNNLAYLMADNRPDEALKYAQRAKELAPDSPVVDNTLGWVLYQKGLYPMAVRYLEMSAHKEPTARRNVQLAMAYLKTGDVAKGRASLEAGVRLDPSVPEAKIAQDLLREVKP